MKMTETREYHVVNLTMRADRIPQGAIVIWNGLAVEITDGAFTDSGVVLTGKLSDPSGETTVPIIATREETFRVISLVAGG